MIPLASQITSLMIVYSSVYSGADQRKHQSSTSLTFVREFTGDGEFPAQRASNAGNVSISWRLHVRRRSQFEQTSLWRLWAKSIKHDLLIYVIFRSIVTFLEIWNVFPNSNKLVYDCPILLNSQFYKISKPWTPFKIYASAHDRTRISKYLTSNNMCVCVCPFDLLSFMLNRARGLNFEISPQT